MPVNCSHAALAGLLLCLFLQGGCGQPDTTADVQLRQAPPELPTAPPPAPAASSPAPAVPTEKPASAAEPVGNTPATASLVLTPPDTPFAKTPTHNFGEVHDADWLAAPLHGTAPDRLLPDMFGTDSNPRRVNVEGELLLDGSQEPSRMLDGLGMKLEISTD